MQHESEDARSLRELTERIEVAKAKRAPPPRREEAHSQAEVAWRMVIELVAGIAIGTGIGFGLDALLGTRPWFLILFCLLGFAAGVNVMMRTAREVAAKQSGAVAPERGTGARVPDETGPRSERESANGG